MTSKAQPSRPRVPTWSSRRLRSRTWGLLFTINPILIGLTQYPVARWAGMRSPRAMLSLGILVQGVAMMLLWPFEGIAIVVGAILLMTFGEMLLAPITSALAVSLARPHTCAARTRAS